MYEAAKEELAKVEAKIGEIGDKITKLTALKVSFNKKAEDADIEGKKLTMKVKSFNQEKGAAERFVNR